MLLTADGAKVIPFPIVNHNPLGTAVTDIDLPVIRHINGQRFGQNARPAGTKALVSLTGDIEHLDAVLNGVGDIDPSTMHCDIECLVMPRASRAIPVAIILNFSVELSSSTSALLIRERS